MIFFPMFLLSLFVFRLVESLQDSIFYNGREFFRTEFESLIIQERDWFLTCLRSSGAICLQDELAWIIPYFSHLGAIPLYRLDLIDSDTVIRPWLEWYLDHVECPDVVDGLCGTVYDYNASGAIETPVNDYDSVDSYAALFFPIARMYAEKQGQAGKDFLVSRKDDIEKIGGALFSVLQPDGLTWAKASYLEKYLMDNTEVAYGLPDMVWIQQDVFNNASGAALYQNVVDDMIIAIERDLWLPDLECYGLYKDWEDVVEPCDLSNWYMDGYAQVWPIWTNLISPTSERANLLYDKVSALTSWWVSSPRNEPDSVMPLVAARMKRKEALDRYLTLREEYIDPGHRYPYMSNSAGTVVEMCHVIIEEWFNGEEEFHICYGIESWRTDLACSGHGSCVAYNTCECEWFWGHGVNGCDVASAGDWAIVIVPSLGVGLLILLLIVIAIIVACICRNKRS